MVAASRLQLSGFALYVEVVTCFTPIPARVVISFSGLSFTKGITGSMRTDTGIPFRVNVSTVFKRLVGEGACGSISFAVFSSSVVMVNATVQEILLKKHHKQLTVVELRH